MSDDSKEIKMPKSKPVTGRLLFNDALDKEIIKFLDKKSVNSSNWIRKAIREKFVRSMKHKRFKLKKITSVESVDSSLSSETKTETIKPPHQNDSFYLSFFNDEK